MMLIGDLLPLYQMHKTLPGEGISTFLWFNDQEKVFSANISRGRSIVRTEGHRTIMRYYTGFVFTWELGSRVWSTDCVSKWTVSPFSSTNDKQSQVEIWPDHFLSWYSYFFYRLHLFCTCSVNRTQRMYESSGLVILPYKRTLEEKKMLQNIL